MLTENSIATGLNSQAYRLGKELGVGGEGTVYEIPGTSLVAKIYKQTALEQEQKLKYMVWHPVSNVADQHGNKIMTLAWPKDVLYDGNGSFVGYTMPRVEGGVEIYEIERGCTTAAAQTMFPGYTWRLNVQVARNLAAAVMALHQQHYVVGDMNCKNIMVNSDGSISMLDTDSCDVTDPSTGHHYKCCVGTEDYLPPELQGVDLRSPRANFTSQTDDFALAVHIFRLLMDNRHPFTCRQLVQPQNSNHQNQLLQNVAQGKCPYIRQIPGFGIPLGAPTLEEIVPDYIRQDFIRTFDYTDATALARVSGRTTATQWVQDLKRLLQECDAELVRCNQNPAHFYLRSKGSCGMCAARKRLDDSMAVDPQELFDRAWAYERQGNMSEAVKLYRQAAEHGHSFAQNNLGICYEFGRGVSPNILEAVRWIRQSAGQGNAVAQCNLGWYLFNGKGIEKNVNEAADWFRKAAVQGNARAQNCLGICYARGEGVPQDYFEATKWYRLAADQGEAYAQNNLSWRYENGEGVPKDLAQAVDWCRKAAAQGHEEAIARLPQLEAQLKQALHPVEIDGQVRLAPRVVQMEANASTLYIDPSICVSCGACQDVCPAEAITEGIHGFEISNACVECGICEDHCPVNAVRRSSSSETRQAAKPVPEKKGLGSFFKKMRDRR
ncbi:MAG: 4Fe-4S binding protein [Eubacteriales bacterium]|nr:4Fe-4S binding protein [Eubacteriales bacterium]